MSFTIKDMIAKYKELEAFVDAENAKHEEAMKPFKDGMGIIRQALLQQLIDQKVDNFKTEAGTAYKKDILNIKVDDRNKFIHYLATSGNWEMLDAGALKDPVEQYLEKHKVPPPGVVTGWFTKCNIRKA